MDKFTVLIGGSSHEGYLARRAIERALDHTLGVMRQLRNSLQYALEYTPGYLQEVGQILDALQPVRVELFRLRLGTYQELPAREVALYEQEQQRAYASDKETVESLLDTLARELSTSGQKAAQASRPARSARFDDVGDE